MNSITNTIKKTALPRSLTKSYLSILTLGLFITACNNPASMNSSLSSLADQSSIIGGKAVPKNAAESLSTVALYAPTKNPDPSLITVANFCTGTLIAPDLVMTAGHCIADFADSLKITQDQLVKNIIVGFGTQVLKQVDAKSPIALVKAFIVHPKYIAGSVNTAETVPMHDIALIRLDRAAPATAKPVAIVTDPTLLKKGLQVNLVGFGLTSKQPLKEATRMMEVVVTVDNPAITSVQFTYLNIGGKSSCSGDSGGPAYINLPTGELAVIGVTSWGDNLCKQIGAYTSVPAFADWIQTEMKAL